MPVPATMTDVTNITYSNGSNENLWRMQVRSLGATNILGTFTNIDVLPYSDGVEIASTIELYFETITDPLNIATGETFTISYDSTSIIVYCPNITTSPTTYYLDTNGVLYSDPALTTAVTPDFDSVSENLVSSEDAETGIAHEDIISLSETTSTESAISVNDIIGLGESYSWYVSGDTVATWPTPTVHYTGSNPYDTDEPIFDSRLVAETDPVVGKMLKIFIKDDNNEWVDFSDRFEQKGVDKLADYGQFKHASEKKGGLPIVESTIGSLILDNGDGFFDGRVTGLTTDLGNTASFETSSDEGIETSWRRREVKFESHLTLIDDTIIVRNLGIFLIKEIDSSFTAKRASVSIVLESKMNLLKRTDAAVVKDGMQWYRNRSIDFLVKELLKTQFSDENNELPDSFYVNSQISLPVPSDIGDGIAYSIFGVPPHDSTGHNTEISYIRAMDIWTWNTGTITSSTDNAYTVTSSTTWGQEGTSGALRPKPGDVITIKSSSNGNDGEYEIKSISSNAIRLKTPLKGLTESSMSYTIVRLYFIHKDSELWEFVPGNNTYNQVGSVTISQFSPSPIEWTSYKIFINDNRVYVLRCFKFRYEDGVVSLYTTWVHGTRLAVYDGTSLDWVATSPWGGDFTCNVAMYLKTPVGMGTTSATGWYTNTLTQSNNWGENIQIPFTQKVRGIHDSKFAEADDRDARGNDITSPDSGGDIDDYLKKNWYTIRRGEADFYYKGYVFIYWDRGDFEVFVPSWSGGDGMLVSLASERTSSDTDTTPDYRAVVRLYNLGTGNNNNYWNTYNTNWWPTMVCIAYTDNSGSRGDSCYFSVLWNDNATDFDGTAAVNVVHRITSSGTITDTWTEANKTVIDLCQYGSSSSPTNAGFLVSMMSRDSDEDQWYEIGTREWNGATWTYTLLMRSASPFIKLTRGGSNEDYDVFIFHKYENRLLRYDHSAGVLVAMAAGNEVVEGEGGICSPLVIDKNTRADIDIIYGVSWSGEDPWALGGLRLPNKGVLWKLDKYLTPFIELADFDGLDVGEAIGKLAQACNHIALFNVLGDFFFIPREITDADDYIIEHVGGKSLIVGNVKKDRGYAEIYNHFTIVPSIVQLSEVEWEIILVKREENEDDRDFTQFVEVNSLNNLKRKVRLACVNGGLVSESPLFKFLVEYDNIDARVGEEVDAGEREILMSSTFGGDQLPEGIHSGDFIIFTHPDDGTQIIKEILGGRGQRNISSIFGNVVNVDDSSIYSVGDKIRLISSTDRFYSTVDVITSPTAITLADSISGTFSDNDDALVEVKGSPAHITIESATDVLIPNGSEVIVTRISASDDSSTNKAWSSDGVTYVLGSGPILFYNFRVNNIDWIKIGCWVEVNDPTGTKTWGKVTAIDETTNKLTVDRIMLFSATNSPTVNVYWSPNADNFVEIPQSGFNARIVDDGDPPVDPLFKAGDVFTISTDGLVLKDDSKSRKLAVSLSSKNKHGKLDFPSIKNRFINPALGEILSRNLLELYKSPHYKLNLPIYYLPLIDFVRINRLASFKIISNKLFPHAQSFSRSFYLRSTTIDLKKNMSSLELIDKDAY